MERNQLYLKNGQFESDSCECENVASCAQRLESSAFSYTTTKLQTIAQFQSPKRGTQSSALLALEREASGKAVIDAVICTIARCRARAKKEGDVVASG